MKHDENRETTMKNDDTEKTKQWQMMKKREENKETWWKNRETTMKNNEKERKKTRTNDEK